MSQGFTGNNFTFQRWDGLYHPIKNLSLDMSTFTTTWNWRTGTSTNNLLNLTTDASANGTGALLNIATGSSSTVLPLLVKAGATTALTVNTSAQVLVGTLTSTRVTYAGTSGLLQDSANMTFNGNRLALATTGNTGGLLIGGDTNLYRSAADALTTDDSLVVGTNLTVSTMTSGSILFAGTSGLVSQDNTNLFWDNTNKFVSLGSTVQNRKLVFYTVVSNDHQYYGLGINSGAFRFQLPDGSAAWKYYVGTGSSTSNQVFDITGSGTISGGSNYSTPSLRTTLNLSGSGAFAASDFTFSQGGLFRACEVSVTGTNDVFFQAVPATTSGYGYLEAFNAAGLILGTGNNTNPVIFQVNRTEVGRFNSTQLLTTVDVVAKGKKFWGGTQYNTGSGYRVSMDLAAFNFGPGFAGVTFDFPSGGRFAPIETSIAGTNDVFFQAIPGTTSGYGYLEAFNSAGLIIGTGNNTNPVSIRINRFERVRFANTAQILMPYGASSGNTYELQFYELSANGTDFLSFKAPDSIATTITHTLPSNTPATGNVLKISSYSSGAAVLSWSAPGISWTEITGTSTTAVAHNGYVTNNASLVTVTLPTPAIGSVVEIVGIGAGGWKALCASGHTIRLGTIVSASTGYAASTNQYDSIRIVGISTTAWSIVSVVGTIDVV